MTVKVGLTINPNMTKLIELIDSDTVPQQRKSPTSEKEEKLKYLRATLKADWSKKINIRINKAENTFYALLKFLNSKTRLYVSIVRSTLTYGYEAWTTTTRLRIFENKLW